MSLISYSKSLLKKLSTNKQWLPLPSADSERLGSPGRYCDVTVAGDKVRMIYLSAKPNTLILEILHQEELGP